MESQMIAVGGVHLAPAEDCEGAVGALTGEVKTKTEQGLQPSSLDAQMDSEEGGAGLRPLHTVFL